MDSLNVLKKPVISEKSFAKSEDHEYIFAVDINANKIEIKRAVEKLFKVNVLKVRTVRIKGKVKRVGRIVGKRNDSKKAYVRIKEGQKIEDFKGI